MVNFSFLGGNGNDKEKTDEWSTNSFQMYKDNGEFTEDNLTNDPNVKQLQQQVIEANKKINDLLNTRHPLSKTNKQSSSNINDATNKHSGHLKYSPAYRHGSTRTVDHMNNSHDYNSNISNKQQDQMLLKQLRLGKPKEHVSESYGTTASANTNFHVPTPSTDSNSVSKLWNVVKNQQAEMARLNNELYMEKLRTEKMARDNKNMENEMYNVKTQIQMLTTQLESLHHSNNQYRTNENYQGANQYSTNGNYSAANKQSNNTTPTLLDDTQYLLSTSPSSLNSRKFADTKTQNGYSFTKQPSADIDSTTELIKGANKYINKYK